MSTFKPVAEFINTAALINSQQLSRFQQLEQTMILHSNSLQEISAQEAQLNEYIDIGLEMACQAGLLKLQALQENWLKRVYNTLLETTKDVLKPKPWREMCQEYLYQPLFALKHIYLSQPQTPALPNKKQSLQSLYKELSVNSQYLY